MSSTDVLRELSREEGFEYRDLVERIHFLCKYGLFDEFEPEIGHSRFSERLNNWLGGLDSTEHRKLLLGLLENFYFIGREEFDVLYRLAFDEHIFQWLGRDIDDLSAQNSLEQFEKELAHTWFCPVTDSMHISRFHHRNLLAGKPMRPDWKTLESFGSEDRILKFLRRHKIRRLVLLEDFVGSGSQALGAIKYALSLRSAIEILVVPLVVCPSGNVEIAKLAAQEPRLQFSPVLELAPERFLRDRPVVNEPEDFPAVRELLVGLDPRVGGEFQKQNDRVFGFKSTGALVAMHTNTPNNAPSVFHSQSSDWDALFPRISRH